ncbi:redox-sensitive transcriptional activator SoxR [Pseudooceanicola sp. LIPI14-2-Ac024]|uniref:redox-sensitive transcriptional activator SoxR n=1 Tax=Pseudooceanicola sp. LIPI14-2-Ac024 TaxID=3344875 RepID=UPI0035D06DFE
MKDGLPIGYVAERTGLAVSAIRHYEAEGLVKAWRNAGGQRRFERSDIRRISFVMIAQKLGFTLSEIRAQLDLLPKGRTPTAADWRRLSETYRAELDARIATLMQLRDDLDGCIGCGCLSLTQCRLHNPEDRLAAEGPGPRKMPVTLAKDMQ